jgi:hypothetical protein
MAWVIGLASLGLLVGALVTWEVARRQTWRWGWTPELSPAAGDGAYRSAPVVLQKPRRMPLVCAVAATCSVFWGALIAFVFAPAGGLFCCMQMTEVEHHDLLFAVGSVGLIAAAMVGFVLGLRLIRLVYPLAARTADSAEHVRQVAFRSLVLHVVVAALLAYWLAGAGDFEMYGIAVVPCAIGMGHTLLLGAAYRMLLRLDREDRQQSAA